LTSVIVSLAPLFGWKDDDFEIRVNVKKECMVRHFFLVRKFFIGNTLFYWLGSLFLLRNFFIGNTLFYWLGSFNWWDTFFLIRPFLAWQDTFFLVRPILVRPYFGKTLLGKTFSGKILSGKTLFYLLEKPILLFVEALYLSCVKGVILISQGSICLLKHFFNENTIRFFIALTLLSC
jgi:hypothetical protein